MQMPHQDCKCNENNIHSWIFHVPICARESYIYIWDVENMHNTLVHIPLGSFIVLCQDVWHGGIVGGEGNVRVHGGIFEAWAFQSASKLTYPPPTRVKASEITRGLLMQSTTISQLSMRKPFQWFQRISWSNWNKCIKTFVNCSQPQLCFTLHFHLVKKIN